jgi:arsenate reductase-like glutaredoxin family protein
MKIEIEIPDDEIADEIRKRARADLSGQIHSYKTDGIIRDTLKQNLSPAIEGIIAEMICKSEELREKVAKEFERQLRAQVAAAIKAAGK